MNTDRDAIRILCYGDSNTWGGVPDGSYFRHPSDIRWTGRLQSRLGDSFEIMEEGLCGRTTVLDDPKEEGRNGKTYLIPCIKSHNPLDLVVLMLGTNDLKERFNQSPEQVAKNVEELVLIIKKLGLNKDKKEPKIILISPAHITEIGESEYGMKGAERKSKELAQFYKEVAGKHGCEFIDIAEYVQPSSIDGCHLEKEAHDKIAQVLEEKIRK